MADLRVALVGYGLAGRAFHAPVLTQVTGLLLTTVVTSSADRAAQARADVPGVEVRPSVEGLDADVVVLATPNRSHVPLGRQLVEAGLPVVVDKPLARTAVEGLALVEAAERAGVLLTVFHNRRWDADVRTAARLLAEGSLGEPQRLETRFERWRPAPGTGWRESADPEEGGGLLLDLGSHQVDVAQQLLGPVVQVYAELDARRPGAAVEDDVMLALTHASGARSTHWLSATAAHRGPRLRLLGGRAAYVAQELDLQEAALRAGLPAWDAATTDGLLVAGDDVRRVASERGDYRLFYAGLERALRGQGPVPVAPRDALAVLRVLDAARRSAATSSVVGL
ncbi:MAG: oxidoreductase domain protein [Frankiales bacterium]|nr:oxidoreductase domain protein [Frankiales bacterium]